MSAETAMHDPDDHKKPGAGREPAATPANPAPEKEDKMPTPELSPDEQMAAYEESLKDSDWGHQPC